MIGLMTLSDPNPFRVEDLEWMAGSWSCPQGEGIFEETWIPPVGGTMQGCGRLVVGSRVRFMEFLSIEEDEKGAVMWVLLGAPSKGDKKPFPFRLTSFDGKKAVFENPSHDFPSKIVYRRSGLDAIDCWLTGTRDGKLVREDYAFKRKKR